MATSNNTEILTLCVTHGDKMNFHYILVFEDWSTAVFPEIFLSGYSEKLPLPLMRERRHAPLSTKLFESMYIYIYTFIKDILSIIFFSGMYFCEREFLPYLPFELPSRFRQSLVSLTLIRNSPRRPLLARVAVYICNVSPTPKTLQSKPCRILWWKICITPHRKTNCDLNLRTHLDL